MIALRRVRGVIVVCSVNCLAACAGGGSLRVADITPAQIPALEEQRAAHPRDPGTLSRLGVAYFKAQRFGDARALLDSATSLDPRNGIAAIYLGMTAEELGDFPAARAAYQHYVDVSRSRTLRGTARQRLQLVGRRELEWQARAALAAETTLTTAAAEPGTIAVMPFAYSGTNAQIQPLTRGLAQLLVTDLARSPRLRVLERERMQAMIDEMHLGTAGQADPQTAVRSGHLLRAERVVQGSLLDQNGELRVDATVVDVGSAGVLSPPSQTDELGRLFDLEKRLAFGIFDRLGIPLSAADSLAISQRPTANLQAFLAYSRGLEAEDRGDFDGARASYLEASQLDPNFAAAHAGAATATELSVAAGQTVAQVEAVVAQNSNLESGGGGGTEDTQRSALQTAADATNPTPTGTQNAETAPPPVQRDPTPDVTNTEGTRPTTGTVVVVIRRPQ